MNYKNISLITFVFPDDNLLRRLKYKNIFFLTDKASEFGKFENSKRVKPLLFKTPKQIKKLLDDILLNAEEGELFLPFIIKDAYTNHAIYLYNKQFNSEVDPEIFQVKSVMNEFLKDMSSKKDIHMEYGQLRKKSYNQLVEDVGTTDMILKPTNASKSIYTFKISNEKDWSDAKNKISPKYEYIAEQYIDGDLYSSDFYFDGQKMFVLCQAREIPFAEILHRFSEDYFEKYKDHISEDFLYFLTFVYTLDLSKVSELEIAFFKKLEEKLKEIEYRGFVHLEYKLDRTKKTIGFIEWGARTGGLRREYINQMHSVETMNLMYDIMKGDTGHFIENKGLLWLRNKDPEINFVKFKVSITEKTHVLKMLEKIPNFYYLSLAGYIQKYLWDNYKLNVEKREINLRVSHDGNYILHPSTKNSQTMFEIILKLDNDNFNIARKKKYQMIEKISFWDL